MAVEALDREPYRYTLGETVRWTIGIPDYDPASATLVYAFVLDDGSEGFSVTATDNGDTTYAAEFGPTETNGKSAGLWRWVARVTTGTEYVVVREGTVEFLPSLTAAIASSDNPRTQAEQDLAAIRTVIAGQVSSAHVSSFNTGEVSLERQPLNELLNLERRLRWRVYQEKRVRAARSGRPIRTRVKAGLR